MPPADSQGLHVLRGVQRTAVHALVSNPAGDVLLIAASAPPASALIAASAPPVQWLLPGGELRHGEQPADGVLRALAAQTGLSGWRPVARLASADVVTLVGRQVSLHTLRLVYDVRVRARDLSTIAALHSSPAPGQVRFVGPADAAALPLASFVAEVLDLPAQALSGPLPAATEAPESWAAAIGERWSQPPDPIPVLVQRPAAYAVLVDESGPGRILLTRLSGSGGIWTLPGGGIDHGEHPVVALRRELHEETGLAYTPGPLIEIGSRHFVGRAPSGRLEDFHGVRLVYGGSVPLDQAPQVIEVGGSSDLAEWVSLEDLTKIGAVASVRESLRSWAEFRRRPPA